MSIYWVGDIQGCDEPLGRLLDHVAFSPSRDRLYVLGDLVNRGPSSLEVLRRLAQMGQSVKCVLGNHDLHLLALDAGARKPSHADTLNAVLCAPDKAHLLHWLGHQSLALFEEQVLMVHAGVLPQWTVTETLELASAIESTLQGPDAHDFYRVMYGNEPAQWSSELQGTERLRCALNALTRIRFCSETGLMEFKTKEASAKSPAGFMPWFDLPGRKTANTHIAFGHWSTLGAVSRHDVWALDTGCVWGGCLTALQRDQASDLPRRIEMKCSSYQTPF
jgi:bis(5'-nucleosyl)-tetraphosphatase (symmetrical)